MKRFIYIVGSLIFFVLVIRFVNWQSDSRFLKRYKSMEISGTVIRKYLDSNDRDTRKVKLLNDFAAYPIYPYDAWDFIDSGDVIEKKSGEFKISVYRIDIPPAIFYMDTML